MVASYQGRAAMVELLIERKADVGKADVRGMTALMLAARAGKPEAAKPLLEAGADKRAEDQSGRTAMDVARASTRTWST